MWSRTAAHMARLSSTIQTSMFLPARSISVKAVRNSPKSLKKLPMTSSDGDDARRRRKTLRHGPLGSISFTNGTTSPSLDVICEMHSDESNLTDLMPSKHFRRCGWTIFGSFVSDKISRRSPSLKK